MMVEGGGKEISEDEFLGAVEFAHENIKTIVAAILTEALLFARLHL
jgi:polyribonucleotide nucleotidyltransferase